jgi:hypothetical protein
MNRSIVMARFNTPAAVRQSTRGPVRSTGVTGSTFEGATGFGRDAKSELFLGAVSSFNEDSFYETADRRLERLRPLIAEVAVKDGAWIQGLVGWLRATANLRSMPVAIAAEAVHARLDAGVTGGNREIVAASIGRIDEPGEFLAYWHARFGRNVPSSVKRGLGDVVTSRLNEFTWLKWRGKGERGNFGLADVLNVVHPKPVDAKQEALFGAVIAQAYGREADLTGLPLAAARAAFMALDTNAKRAFVTGDGAVERMRAAGLTHEVVAGVLGRLDATVWESLVPTMGYQALLMNLRRIAEAGVSDATLAAINARLRDPEQVKQSRMYPMRFLSAYRNAPLEFAGALERAANATLENIPALSGRTLVLVDRSGSMQGSLSQRGSLTRVDAANVFGAALALRGEAVDLVAFGTSSKVLPFRKGDSLLRLADSRADMGGTATRDAVKKHYNGHDRVVVLTDEQAGYGWGYRSAEEGVFKGVVPEKVPTFTWNLAGYQQGHDEEGPFRFTFGGLTDVGFDLIEALERGFAAGWPWEG